LGCLSFSVPCVLLGFPLAAVPPFLLFSSCSSVVPSLFRSVCRGLVAQLLLGLVLRPLVLLLLRLLWCQVFSGLLPSVSPPQLFSLQWLVFCFLVPPWFLGSCPFRAWWSSARRAGGCSCFVPCLAAQLFWLVVLSRSGSGYVSVARARYSEKSKSQVKKFDLASVIVEQTLYSNKLHPSIWNIQISYPPLVGRYNCQRVRLPLQDNR
jgi:hypothetical protein